MRKLFAYHLKQIIRQREALIWGFSLPVVLLLIFSMVFRPTTKEDLSLPVSRIGLIQGQEADFPDFMADLEAKKGVWKNQKWTEETPEKNAKLPLVYGNFSTLKEARAAMNAGAIDAIVLDAKAGKYETRMARSYVLMVVQQVLRSYQTKTNMEEIAKSAVTKAPTSVPAVAQEQKVEALEVNPDLRKGGVDQMLSFQFACIAYITFYAFSMGNHLLDNLHANQSPLGLREQISPLERRKSFVLHFGAYLVIYIGFTLVLYLLLRLLGTEVATKTNIWALLLLLFLGQCCGIVIGVVVAALLPEAKGVRQAIGILLPLFLGFLSGMMVSGVRTSVQAAAPLLDALNPVNMVKDGLYGLYTQGVGEIYHTAMAHLAITLVLFLGITIIALRRDRYESL
ncbi:ABC transporter permease [uncultured Levyella sp.]|uniref:ABC transporter permease n=1 Tax=uncultured Levyella sp. TaxID=1715800 RepID=UPI00258E3573|nr:ABC transporter permease [uncultured Levyella sp.]